MQSQQVRDSKPNPNKETPLIRIAIILLMIFIFIAIVFGIYQGIKILRARDAEPTATPTAAEVTPDLQATATAGCTLFMQRFPGTPCPEVEHPSIIATATAACLQFRTQFPGTPCP